MQEMFEKLERMKYGNESIRQSERLLKYWDEIVDEDEWDDSESTYEYIVDKYNK